MNHLTWPDAFAVAIGAVCVAFVMWIMIRSLE